MIDGDRWVRLAVDLHDVCTDEDPDVNRAERRAVFLYMAVHKIMLEGDD